MRGYKLTDATGCTQNNTQWAAGVTHEAEAGDGPLCSNQWIHWYPDPLIAEMMNPMHGKFGADGLLWEIEAMGKKRHDYCLKSGSKRVTAIRQIPRIRLTPVQRINAAIHLAQMILDMKGYHSPVWEQRANDWLTKRSRSTITSGTMDFPTTTAVESCVINAAWYAIRAADYMAYTIGESTEPENWLVRISVENAARAVYAAAYAMNEANAADVFPMMLMLALCAGMDEPAGN